MDRQTRRNKRVESNEKQLQQATLFFPALNFNSFFLETSESFPQFLALVKSL